MKLYLELYLWFSAISTSLLERKHDIVLLDLSNVLTFGLYDLNVRNHLARKSTDVVSYNVCAGSSRGK